MGTPRPGYWKDRYDKHHALSLAHLGSKCSIEPCSTPTDRLHIVSRDPLQPFNAASMSGHSWEWIKNKLSLCRLFCFAHLLEDRRRRRPWRHGTMYGWMKQKCQCEECEDARLDHALRRKEDRRDARLLNGEPVKASRKGIGGRKKGFKVVKRSDSERSEQKPPPPLTYPVAKPPELPIGFLTRGIDRESLEEQEAGMAEENNGGFPVRIARKVPSPAHSRVLYEGERVEERSDSERSEQSGGLVWFKKEGAERPIERSEIRGVFIAGAGSHEEPGSFPGRAGASTAVDDALELLNNTRRGR